MPKGKGSRKLRDELKQLREITAKLDPQGLQRNVREQSRPAIGRPVTYDWECCCGFYCYPDRDRCPRCDRSKGVGRPCPGFRRRLFVGTQERQTQAAARTTASAAQQRPPPPPQYTRQQQQQQQTTHKPSPQQLVQRQAQPPPPNTSNVATTQPARSYADAAKTAAQTAQGQTIAVGGNVPRVPGLQALQPAATSTVVQHAAAQLVGAVAPPANPPQGSFEIHSNGNNPSWEVHEDADDRTVQELDPQITDPNLILRRMQGITKGTQRRTARLERAQQECEAQRQAVEEAKALLQIKEQAVVSAEADVRYFKEVHTDLAKKYTALTEASAQLDRDAKQKEEQQSELQDTQQALWQAATTIRNLGADPRIDAALAALESLFLEVQGQPVQQPQQPQQQPSPPPSNAAPIAAPCTQSSSSPAPSAPKPAPPPNEPSQPIICPHCWSVSCRCRLRVATDVPVTTMEVDQERGTKRSCVEAALPEKASDGQQSPGALLVDSSGLPVGPGSAAAAEEQKPPSTIADVPTVLADARVPGKTAVEQEPEAMVVEPARGAAAEAAEDSVVTVSAADPCNSGVPEGYAKAEKVPESDKEQSRKSFSNLVKAACSQRSYPY